VPLLELDALTPADIEAWRELAAAAVEPNPFHEFDYCRALADGTRQAPQLLVERDGPQWRSCLPVRRSMRWHRAPVPHVASWRAYHLYALLGTPLLAPGADASGLVDGLLRLRATTLVALDWLHEGGPVLDALRYAMAARGVRPIEYERFSRAALSRRPDNDYSEQTVSSKHRREYRRQLRKLGEEVGGVSITDRAGDPTAVDGLIELEARQAVAARGEVLAADAGHRAFFAQMCAAYAAAGRLQLLELRAGDTALAYKCNLLAGDGMFMLKIAYDETYKAYSPGMQLELEMLNFFHERPNTNWMDSCADPNNTMINRLWPDRRTLVSLVLPTTRLAGPTVRALKAYRDRHYGD
jgi:CelD/BcsL family acetyltransferase involved in cellulose biosynthesis